MNKNKQLMEDIYKIGLECKDPISIDQLEEIYEKKKNTKLKRTDIVYILNVLENARFCCIKNENNTIITKMRPQEIVKKLIKLSDVDFLIYTKVENSHNNGIWTADLRKQTKLLIHQVQKGLKLLCENKLIKQVNNIHVKNRKMYILYGLEASEKVIGGSFYTDGEFDIKVVTYIRENICFYLRNNNNASVSSVIKYIKQMDERMKYYTDSDIQHVIDTLIYEDQIKICKNYFHEDSLYLYNNLSDEDESENEDEENEDEYITNNDNSQKIRNLNNDGNLMNNLKSGQNNPHMNINPNDENRNEQTMRMDFVPTIPCISCEIFKKCNSDINTRINPSSCIYLNKYLELEF